VRDLIDLTFAVRRIPSRGDRSRGRPAADAGARPGGVEPAGCSHGAEASSCSIGFARAVQGRASCGLPGRRPCCVPALPMLFLPSISLPAATCALDVERLALEAGAVRASCSVDGWGNLVPGLPFSVPGKAASTVLQGRLGNHPCGHRGPARRACCPEASRPSCQVLGAGQLEPGQPGASRAPICWWAARGSAAGPRHGVGQVPAETAASAFRQGSTAERGFTIAVAGLALFPGARFGLLRA